MQRLPPQAIDERSSAAGLRLVAIFEAVKGFAVLALALGLLSLLHRDLEELAEHLLVHIHISAEHKLGRAILEAAAGTTDRRIWGLAAAGVVYALVRLIEAYGLWNRRVWAEWFALLSGSLYLPLEIVKAAEHTDWLHVGVLAVNVAIVLYMLEIRLRAAFRLRPRSADPTE